MGCTIHLEGRLISPGHASALIDEVSSIASVLGWDVDLVDDEHLRGVSLLPDPHCDPLHLLFDRDGVLRYPTSSTDDGQRVTMRTQGVPDDITIGVATLIRQIKDRYFAELDVQTEDGEWVSDGDVDEAVERGDRTHRNLSVSIAELESIEQLFGVIPVRDVDTAAARNFWREQDREATPEERGIAPDREVLEAWTLDEWVEYFECRDAHLYPALKHMRECDETPDGCAEAIDRGRSDEERPIPGGQPLYPLDTSEAGPRQGDRDDSCDTPREASSEPSAQEGDDALEDTDDRPCVLTEISRECDGFTPAITVMGEVSIQRQFDWSPTLEYVTYSTMASIMGIIMAWRYWAREEGFPIALTARYQIAARRYAQVRRLLDQAGHPLWTNLAGQATRAFERSAVLE